MLNSEISRPTTLEAAPWRHLDIPHRMARVIERRRHMLDGTVTERNFGEEPETCDLSLEELRANIGKAQQLIDDGAPEPAYDRAARLDAGVSLVMGMLPAIPAIHATLRDNGFTNSELGDLWDELIARAADDFHADRAPIHPTGARDGLPDWGRRMLERNAN